MKSNEVKKYFKTLEPNDAVAFYNRCDEWFESLNGIESMNKINEFCEQCEYDVYDIVYNFSSSNYFNLGDKYFVYNDKIHKYESFNNPYESDYIIDEIFKYCDLIEREDNIACDEYIIK